MAVQGEELASKIEEKIKQAIDSVVEDIRVSIDDVRGVVNQQFDAVLQSVLADAKAMSVRAELDEMLAGQAPPPPAAPPAPPQVESGPGSRELKKAIQRIERGGTQVDVLNALLEQLLGFGSRAALLILKSDTFSGWKGKGFSSFGGQDESVKRLSAGPGEVTELDRLRLEEKVVSWDGGSFAHKLGVSPARTALIVPMVIKDKISAAVYVDQMPGSDAAFDQAAVELLVFATGLLIDTLAIRRKVPSPTLSLVETDAEPFESEGEPEMLSPEDIEAPRAAQPEPQELSVDSEPSPAPRTEHDQPVPQMEMEEPAPTPAPAPPQVEAPLRHSGQIQPPQQRVEPASIEPPSIEPPVPEPPPPAREAAPPAAPSPAPSGPQPTTQVRPPSGSGESTQYVPPPGVKGGFAARAEMGEDAKKHDDARRFARLLVSEIKLYNEGKVDQGRKNGDLYERLKEDIDRSRQMYEDRVPTEVRDVSNYFYDELVRILADGNADALGL